MFVGLVKRDLDAQEGRMARMEIGAKLAGLKVRLQTKEDLSTVTLAALRRDRGRDKRVAVLVGGADAVKSSLESALPYGAALETSDILIVPLVLESRPGMSGGGAAMFQASGAENDLESAVGSAHVALPVALNRWQEYIDSEVSVVTVGGANCLLASVRPSLQTLYTYLRSRDSHVYPSFSLRTTAWYIYDGMRSVFPLQFCAVPMFASLHAHEKVLWAG